jgi:hypothetical protein
MNVGQFRAAFFLVILWSAVFALPKFVAPWGSESILTKLFLHW